VASRTEVDTSTGTEFTRYAAGTIHDTATMIQTRGVLQGSDHDFQKQDKNVV
jgi:hypothetical protein